MESSNIYAHSGDIRKIEDIIDLQNANGTMNKHVAFSLPVDTDETKSATLAKSVESGLSKVKPGHAKKKLKKYRGKRHTASMPEVFSWPSDSDITVLRMKLYTDTDASDNVGDIVTGDGLHHPGSSSMINLATLVLKSQSPSKTNVKIDEYLMPISSWDHRQGCETSIIDDNQLPTNQMKIEDSCCDYSKEGKLYSRIFENDEDTLEHHLDSKESDAISVIGTKSKVAKFLRLYFCPCCTCLYKMEALQEYPSTYGDEKHINTDFLDGLRGPLK